MRFKDYIEFTVRDHKGVVVADRAYTLVLADGTKKEGRLDDNGHVRLDELPAGPFTIEVEGMPPLKAVQPEGGSVIGKDGDNRKNGEKENHIDNQTKDEKETGKKFDIDKAVEYLNDNYIRDSFGKGRCAYYVRMAIEAGGIKVYPRPTTGYAADFGSFLVDLGFKEINGNDYDIDTDPKKGDIAIIQPYKGQTPPAGHMAMYNGSKWISDFLQRDMWGGEEYRKHKPNFKIYRW